VGRGAEQGGRFKREERKKERAPEKERRERKSERGTRDFQDLGSPK